MNAQLYFKNMGRGSQITIANRMGYSVQHLRSILSQKKPASPFFVQCLKDCCPGIDTKELVVTNGLAKALPRISVRSDAFEVLIGRKYLGRFKTKLEAENFIKGLL